jgi:hypothetical protein
MAGVVVPHAQRQAWVLNPRAFDALHIIPMRDVGPGRVAEMADPRDRTGERLDFEAALQELRKLPDRLQAAVLMRSQSATHEQVAEALGVSPQRIGQLLQAAGAKLREISERRIEKRSARRVATRGAVASARGRSSRVAGRRDRSATGTLEVLERRCPRMAGRGARARRLPARSRAGSPVPSGRWRGRL